MNIKEFSQCINRSELEVINALKNIWFKKDRRDLINNNPLAEADLVCTYLSTNNQFNIVLDDDFIGLPSKSLPLPDGFNLVEFSAATRNNIRMV